jgi:predicted O-methyltransferase YrrM
MDAIRSLLEAALRTPGWRLEPDLLRLANESQDLGGDPVIVEVGCLFGRSTLMLAGARKIKGSGRVHCIDPFDGSGDSFSSPHYAAMLAGMRGGTFLSHFLSNVEAQDLQDYVRVHKGTVEAAAGGWTLPIDMLLLDGDQSRSGARRAYDLLIPFLRPGGLLVLSNSAERPYAPDHDGHAELLRHTVAPPGFTDVERGDTSWARKAVNR